MREPTQEERDRILDEIVADQTPADLLQIPGIREILAAHFSSEVIYNYEQTQAEKGRVNN